MTIPPYSRLASRLLAKGAPAHVPPPSDAARADAIAAIEAAIVWRRRRQLWMRGAFSALAAGVVFGLVFVGRTTTPKLARQDPRPATVVSSVIASSLGGGAHIVGGEMLRADGQRLVPGAHVRALAGGDALLTFASGSKVTVDESSEIVLVEAADSQVLALDHGALRAQVAKLGPSRRFVVRTKDAEVEVHGTSFRVATVTPDPACGAGSITRLEVYEGVVSVRAGGVETRVGAGGRWPQGCESATVPPAVATPVEPTIGEQKRAEAPKMDQRSTTAPAAVSDLAWQNDLFAGASAARRAGDLANAVSELEQLLAKYPRGPLAQDAEVERMKLLHVLDQVRAARAARAYLARYPDGFARVEAAAILGAGE